LGQACFGGGQPQQNQKFTLQLLDADGDGSIFWDDVCKEWLWEPVKRKGG